MSQVSGTAPNGTQGGPSYSNARPSTTGRAVLLLLLAVVIGVLLLHELDNGTGQAALASKPAAKAATLAAPTTVAPTTVPLRSPAEIKVLVANGVGVAGAASKVAGRLQPIGYQLAKPGNTTNKAATSSVEYAAGYQQEAMVLATSLGLPATSVSALANPAPVTDMQASSIVVIVGTDLAATGTAAAGSTGTTVTTLASGATANPLTNGPLSTATTLAPTTTITSVPTN